MEAVTLSDLGPVIAAVVGPMLVMVVASMRYQHLDSIKTRKLITDSVSERLARIEGHLRISPQQRRATTGTPRRPEPALYGPNARPRRDCP